MNFMNPVNCLDWIIYLKYYRVYALRILYVMNYDAHNNSEKK